MTNAKSASKKTQIKRKVTAIIERLVETDFTSLRSSDFFINMESNRDYIAATSFKRGKIEISLDMDDIQRMNHRACVGVVVHELCHIERDIRKNVMHRFAEAALYCLLPMLETRDERATDELAIAKGYGRELMEFQKYHDQHYEPYTAADGLTQREIRARCTGKAARPSSKP